MVMEPSQGAAGWRIPQEVQKLSLPHPVKSLPQPDAGGSLGRLKAKLVTGPGYLLWVNTGRIQEQAGVEGQRHVGRRQGAGSCWLCLEPLPHMDSILPHEVGQRPQQDLSVTSNLY